jgi:glycosyltransferase involved in cell wall biosynthesis
MSSLQPLVSVVIPCFNQGAFLAEAVQSALCQISTEFDVIIVDDGSTDSTPDVIQKFLSPRVRSIRQENQGLSAARNAGLAASTAEYIVFLDADDRLLPDALQKGLACLQENPECAFAFGRHRLISENGSLLKECFPYRVTSDHYAALLHFNFIEMHATVMYRRPVFEVVGPFNPSLKACEDYDIYLRITRRFPVVGHNNLVAEYRQHSANMTHDSSRMLSSALRVLEFQWPCVSQQPGLHYAFQNGLQYWRAFYGERLLEEALKSIDHHNPAAGPLRLLRNNCRKSWKNQLRAWECRFLHPEPTDQLLDHVTHFKEQLFAEGPEGVQDASWINDERVAYEFRLYEGTDRQHCLASVIVTRDHHSDSSNSNAAETVANPFIKATPNPVPDQDMPGVTTIRWNTGSNRTGQVYVSLSIRPESFWLSPSATGPSQAEASRAPARMSHNTQAGLVSVIVPCYNQGHFLQEALDSVFSQTYSNYEIIVIDDGSTEFLDELRLACSNPRVQCFRQENKGLAGARNAGLLKSKGEFVVFLDADDRLLPRTVELGLAALSQNPAAAAVYGNYRLIGRDGSFLGAGQPVYKGTDHYERLLRANFIATPASVLYRRSALEKVGLFDTNLSPAADYDLYLRISREFPLCAQDEVVAEYRQHGSSMSSNSALMLDAVLNALDKQRPSVAGNPKLEEALQSGIRCWQNYYGDLMANAVHVHVLEGNWKLALKNLLLLIDSCSDDIASAKVKDTFNTLRTSHKFLPDQPGETNGAARPEHLFAGSPKGKQEAPWITVGAVYEFRLYSGQNKNRLLGSVAVTRASSDPELSFTSASAQRVNTNGSFIRATPNPVPAGEGPGVASIEWNAGSETSAQVYLCLIPLHPRKA